MKLFVLTLRIFTFVLIVLCINSNPGCKDPYDYAPSPDSLVAPPDEVPELLFPPDDTHFVFGQQGHGWDTIWVSFKWTGVTDAQYYDLVTSTDSNFPDSMSWRQRVSSPSHIVVFGPQDCYWRVCAGSNYWTWYTGWSKTGRFKLVVP